MNELMKSMELEKLEEKLGLAFSDSNLLRTAVTHKSFPNENRRLKLKNNERLEFLGDSVLSLSISTYLFKNFRDAPEGRLAKMRAILVSSDALARKARELELSEHLLLGRGEEMTGGRERDSILADTLEAVIGAVYLEHGFQRVDDFIIDFFQSDIDKVRDGDYTRDYKTLLQEFIQQDGDNRPEYVVVSETGPDHNKSFAVQVKLGEEVIGQGQGSSKKDAEQLAARRALENIGEI